MSMKPSDYTMFKISKPWGYYPPAVEEMIRKYEVALNTVNGKLIESRQIIQQQNQKIERLQDELRRMNIEMQNIEVPTVSDVVEEHIFDKFKNYNDPAIKMMPSPDYIESDEASNATNEYNNETGEDTDFMQDIISSGPDINTGSFRNESTSGDDDDDDMIIIT